MSKFIPTYKVGEIVLLSDGRQGRIVRIIPPVHVPTRYFVRMDDTGTIDDGPLAADDLTKNIPNSVEDEEDGS